MESECMHRKEKDAIRGNEEAQNPRFLQKKIETMPYLISFPRAAEIGIFVFAVRAIWRDEPIANVVF